MSGWISSKLKVAETFLQQIDQQAAESLGKTNKQEAGESNSVSPPRPVGSLPLKDQLKKSADVIGKLHNDSNSNLVYNRDRNKEIVKPLLGAKSNPTAGDWTELLSSPNDSALSHGNGVSLIRNARKGGANLGSLSSNLSGFEAKRNQKINGIGRKLKQRLDTVKGGLTDGKPSHWEESRKSSVESQTNGSFLEAREVDHKSIGSGVTVAGKCDENVGNNGPLNFTHNGQELHSRDVSEEDVSQTDDKNHRPESITDSLKDAKLETAKEVSVTDDMKIGSSSGSNGESDSDSDSSASTSDSESEREREERKRQMEQIIAERKTAKAIAAIKERENVVARLEGEKESLEKMLEDRAKQQEKEASDLQKAMIETLEAVDKEKQKHNNTRMEALIRLAKLETANADLAKSLASVQWNLQVAVNQVAELRQQIELKQATHEELKKRMANNHQTGASLNQLAGSKGVEFEREILEAEYSFTTDKIARLQDKAKMLEANIEMTRKEIENPTEVEVELKRRLSQFTDHLIQKQAQVEALSSEKATMQFRIEAVSRLLEENKNAVEFSGTLSSFDIESGNWDLSKSKLRPMFENRMRSGGRHLGSLLRQLDAIFSAGAVYLRRNSVARLWSAVYLVCLHFWVIYILMSHSQESQEARSGAVISLENINNNTAGI